MGQRRWVVLGRALGTAVLGLTLATAGLVTASAAPGPDPAPVRQLVASQDHRGARTHGVTGVRQALRVPGGEDDETFLVVDPGCAPAKGKAKPNAVVVSSTKLKLDYVLTGDGVSKTGTVKVKAHRATSVKLKAVRAGSYRLTLSLHGTSELVADQTFSVLPCLVVTTGCHAVTFSNPAGNPSAVVTYSARKKHQDLTVEVEPGTSRTVRADYSKIEYESYTTTDDPGPTSLGRGTVKVKQKCGHGPAQPGDNAVQTWALVGCSTAGAPALATLGWSAQPTLKQRRWEVLDGQQQVVLQGSYKDRKETTVSVAPGSYTYRSLANGLVQPFEEVAFEVLACVQVTPRCRAIEIQNPNDAALEVLVLGDDDEGDDEGEDEDDRNGRKGRTDADEPEGDGGVTPLAANGTVTIPWTASRAWVLALPEGTFGGSARAFLSLASPLSSEGEPARVTVPQDC